MRTRRLKHIFKPDGRAFIVAFDHGMIDGPAKGMEQPAGILRAIAEGGADAILTKLSEARSEPGAGNEREHPQAYGPEAGTDHRLQAAAPRTAVAESAIQPQASQGKGQRAAERGRQRRAPGDDLHQRAAEERGGRPARCQPGQGEAQPLPLEGHRA